MSDSCYATDRLDPNNAEDLMIINEFKKMKVKKIHQKIIIGLLLLVICVGAFAVAGINWATYEHCHQINFSGYSRVENFNHQRCADLF